MRIDRNMMKADLLESGNAELLHLFEELETFDIEKQKAALQGSPEAVRKAFDIWKAVRAFDLLDKATPEEQKQVLSCTSEGFQKAYEVWKAE